MHYLNIHTAWMGEPEFAGATNEQLGIWTRLSNYCAVQENGGKILRCDKWTDRQWLTTCAVTFADVRIESPLWSWDGSTVCVRNYPIAQEREVSRKREAGRRTAKLRWDVKKAKQNKALMPTNIAQLPAQLPAQL